ncbi:hypothetical protein [Streptomyces venezuelae]|nr:hypothetical protein [Streptomyces venezuelae]
MSMLTRARHIGRHRGKTPAQLKKELDQAGCTLIGLATEIDGLRAERDRLEAQLDAAGIELSGVRDDLSAARKQIRHLDAVVLLRDRKIDDLNRKIDVGVKAEHVISKTQELDGEEIRRHLHASPQAAVTNPGTVRQTSWGRDGEGVA